jgi:hypothetical protein
MTRDFWAAFFARVLSPQTARFVLALLALGFAAYGANRLLVDPSGTPSGEAAIFAIGQLFALATMAFGYYFGSTARGDTTPLDTRVVNKPDDPVPVEEEHK